MGRGQKRFSPRRFPSRDHARAPRQKRGFVETTGRGPRPIRPGQTFMSLPLPKPFAPMEARLVNEMPEGDGWQYEPKWDGFRCLVFRDKNNIELQSKSGQSLTRYFP